METPTDDYVEDLYKTLKSIGDVYRLKNALNIQGNDAFNDIFLNWADQWMHEKEKKRTKKKESDWDADSNRN